MKESSSEAKEARNANLIQLIGLAIGLTASFVYHSGRITALEVQVATLQQSHRDYKPTFESVARIDERLTQIERKLDKIVNSNSSNDSN